MVLGGSAVSDQLWSVAVGVAVFDVALPQAGKDLRLEVCRLNETQNLKTRKPDTRNS